VKVHIKGGRNMKILKLAAVTLTAALVFIAVSAQAASLNPTLDDRFQVRLGPFYANMDSKITVASGQEIDLEERFDDNALTGAIYLNWRVTPRINLEFGYSQVTRDESERIEQDVPLGDLAVLPGGSSFSGEFNTRVYRFAAGYSVLRSEKSEVGITLGVSAVNIEDSLAFTPAGGPKITVLESDTTEPLGSIGLYGTWAFSPQWLISGRVGYLGLKLGDLEGKMWDVFGGVEYRPWKSVGVGLAYVYNDADVTVQAEIDTDVNWTYQGPFACLTLGFGTVAK